MKKAKLVTPSKKYKDSFIAGIKEIQATDAVDAINTNHLLTEIKMSVEEFDDILLQYRNNSKGKNLPKNYVPSTTYWLVNNDEFIGRVQIRHSLTDDLMNIGGHIGYIIRPSKRNLGYGTKILELGIQKARKMDLNRVLLTCDKSNIGSKKIIEKNGGILENEYCSKDTKIPKLRYWINI